LFLSFFSSTQRKKKETKPRESPLLKCKFSFHSCTPSRQRRRVEVKGCPQTWASLHLCYVSLSLSLSLESCSSIILHPCVHHS
jgi:hypothetical protein